MDSECLNLFERITDSPVVTRIPRSLVQSDLLLRARQRRTIAPHHLRGLAGAEESLQRLALMGLGP